MKDVCVCIIFRECVYMIFTNFTRTFIANKTVWTQYCNFFKLLNFFIYNVKHENDSVLLIIIS